MVCYGKLIFQQKADYYSFIDLVVIYTVGFGSGNKYFNKAKYYSFIDLVVEMVLLSTHSVYFYPFIT